MRYIINTLYALAACGWLYFFIVEFPLLLTAGTANAIFAIALIALGVICVGVLLTRKIKGVTKKEVPNENRTTRHDCGPGTCNHRL